MADAIRRKLLSLGESFVFETVFSDPAGDKISFLKDAAQSGYTVIPSFIGISGPDTKTPLINGQQLHSAPPVCMPGRWNTILPMGKQLEAVYENGVLRPLQPLGLVDQQCVLVTVCEIPNYPGWAKAQLEEIGPASGLEAVQRQLAIISGSMSKFVIEERGER